MKKILLALFAMTLVSQVCSQGSVMGKPADDTVVVIIVLENTKPSSPTNRSAASNPIECFYHTTTNTLELVFKSRLGNVVVSLDNLTTGETNEYAGNSSYGMMTMPVTPNSCYAMNIATESGRTFRASFITGDFGEE